MISDPNEDQFEKRRTAKKERVAKNELQRLRNIARAQSKKGKQVTWMAAVYEKLLGVWHAILYSSQPQTWIDDGQKMFVVEKKKYINWTDAGMSRIIFSYHWIYSALF